MLRLPFLVLATVEAGPVPLAHIGDTSENVFSHGISVPVQGEGDESLPLLLTIGIGRDDIPRVLAATNKSFIRQLVSTSTRIPFRERKANFSGFTGLHSAGNKMSFVGFDNSTGIHRWHGCFTVPLSSESTDFCMVVDSSTEIPCESEDRSSEPHTCEHGRFVATSSALLGAAGDVLYFAAANSTEVLIDRGSETYEGIFRADIRQHDASPCKATLSVVVDSFGTNTPARRIHGISSPSTSSDGQILAFAAQDGPPLARRGRTHVNASLHRPYKDYQAPSSDGLPLLGGPNITIFVLRQDTKGRMTLASMANTTTSLPRKRWLQEETFTGFSGPLVDRGESASSVVFMGSGSLGTFGLYHLNVTSGRICTIADTIGSQFLGFDPACISVGDGILAFCAVGSVPETSGVYAARLPHCGDADAIPGKAETIKHVPSHFIPVAMLGDVPPSPKRHDGRFSYLLTRAESLVGNALAFYGTVEGGTSVGYDGIFVANLTSVFGSVGSNSASFGHGNQLDLVI